jgi:hypothetical protein
MDGFTVLFFPTSAPVIKKRGVMVYVAEFKVFSFIFSLLVAIMYVVFGWHTR